MVGIANLLTRLLAALTGRPPAGDLQRLAGRLTGGFR
jgi:hypothetical protein